MGLYPIGAGVAFFDGLLERRIVVLSVENLRNVEIFERVLPGPVDLDVGLVGAVEHRNLLRRGGRVEDERIGGEVLGRGELAADEPRFDLSVAWFGIGPREESRRGGVAGGVEVVSLGPLARLTDPPALAIVEGAPTPGAVLQVELEASGGPRGRFVESGLRGGREQRVERERGPVPFSVVVTDSRR